MVNDAFSQLDPQRSGLIRMFRQKTLALPPHTPWLLFITSTPAINPVPVSRPLLSAAKEGLAASLNMWLELNINDQDFEGGGTASSDVSSAGVPCANHCPVLLSASPPAAYFAAADCDSDGLISVDELFMMCVRCCRRCWRCHRCHRH